MSDGIYSALSGAIAQQRHLDVVSNNVANANTSGFKQDRVAFSSFVGGSDGKNVPNSLRFAGVTQVQTNTQPGSLRPTGNPLDLAIQGNGMFVLDTPNGLAFTRDGSFILDSNGQLVSANGFPVQGTGVFNNGNSDIIIPLNMTNIEIMPDGTIQSGNQLLGKLAIAVTDEEQDLAKLGNTLFNGGAGLREMDYADNISVVQGSVERSNVNAIQGMNELITITRSFDAMQRVISTYKDIDRSAANEINARG